jgi:hypothetical protein
VTNARILDHVEWCGYVHGSILPDNCHSVKVRFSSLIADMKKPP